MKNTQTFEFGLVGAGAISAGAYTSGVIDLMVYALDSWYGVKNTDRSVPPHDVKLSVFSGSSAGGITAALAVGFLGSDQPPIANEEQACISKGKNKLFDSWVDRIDITSLLECRDLPDKNSPVVSVLDSSILSEIADSGLDVTPRKARRPYVAENFELLLTVTNLRGVPYAFELVGNHPTSYEMSLHADYVHFRISDSCQENLPDRYTLSWVDLGTANHPIKKKLKQSALASGAFPGGFAPRTLSCSLLGDSDNDPYCARKWPVPTPETVGPHQCVTPMSIPVHWGGLPQGYQYDYVCVDGGVMNNEPLELARRILAGPGARNKRNGVAASKAVILIDPFPSKPTFNPKDKPGEVDLLKLVFGLFNALKNQARFKPDELMLAADDNIYSRFMIAPSRDNQAYSIACGSLEGFGGFLKRDFRAHDFFLGRRNAQKFLRDHFVLPENNSLFDAWSEQMKEHYCVSDPVSGKPRLRDNKRLLPIIPLVGEAGKKPCYKAKWPRYTEEDLTKLVQAVESRVDNVVNRLVEKYFKTNNLFVRFVAKIIIGRKKADVVRLVQNKVSDELKKMQLFVS